jgi:hypothetical protein
MEKFVGLSGGDGACAGRGDNVTLDTFAAPFSTFANSFLFTLSSGASEEHTKLLNFF